MTENNLSKLKTMLSLKYMSFLLISLTSSSNENKAYISSELALTYDLWENWKFNHGIKESLEENEKGYIKIEVANTNLFIPEDFAMKIIVLNFAP